MVEEPTTEKPCSSCAHLKQELESTKKEQASTLKMIKEKIISTDKLIKKYQKKCDDYEKQGKSLKDLSIKYEECTRNAADLQEQLKKSLEVTEPQKKNITRLIQEKFSYEEKIMALQKANTELEGTISSLGSKLQGRDDAELEWKKDQQEHEKQLEKERERFAKIKEELSKLKDERQKDKVVLRRKTRELSVQLEKREELQSRVNLLKQDIKALKIKSNNKVLSIPKEICNVTDSKVLRSGKHLQPSAKPSPKKSFPEKRSEVNVEDIFHEMEGLELSPISPLPVYLEDNASSDSDSNSSDEECSGSSDSGGSLSDLGDALEMELKNQCFENDDCFSDVDVDNSLEREVQRDSVLKYPLQLSSDSENSRTDTIEMQVESPHQQEITDEPCVGDKKMIANSNIQVSGKGISANIIVLRSFNSDIRKLESQKKKKKDITITKKDCMEIEIEINKSSTNADASHDPKMQSEHEDTEVENVQSPCNLQKEEIESVKINDAINNNHPVNDNTLLQKLQENETNAKTDSDALSYGSRQAESDIKSEEGAEIMGCRNDKKVEAVQGDTKSAKCNDDKTEGVLADDINNNDKEDFEATTEESLIVCSGRQKEDMCSATGEKAPGEVKTPTTSLRLEEETLNGESCSLQSSQCPRGEGNSSSMPMECNSFANSDNGGVQSCEIKQQTNQISESEKIYESAVNDKGAVEQCIDVKGRYEQDNSRTDTPAAKDGCLVEEAVKGDLKQLDKEDSILAHGKLVLWDKGESETIEMKRDCDRLKTSAQKYEEKNFSIKKHLLLKNNAALSMNNLDSDCDKKVIKSILSEKSSEGINKDKDSMVLEEQHTPVEAQSAKKEISVNSQLHSYNSKQSKNNSDTYVFDDKEENREQFDQSYESSERGRQINTVSVEAMCRSEEFMCSKKVTETCGTDQSKKRIAHQARRKPLELKSGLLLTEETKTLVNDSMDNPLITRPNTVKGKQYVDNLEERTRQVKRKVRHSSVSNKRKKNVPVVDARMGDKTASCTSSIQDKSQQPSLEPDGFIEISKGLKNDNNEPTGQNAKHEEAEMNFVNNEKQRYFKDLEVTEVRELGDEFQIVESVEEQGIGKLGTELNLHQNVADCKKDSKVVSVVSSHKKDGVPLDFFVDDREKLEEIYSKTDFDIDGVNDGVLDSEMRETLGAFCDNTSDDAEPVVEITDDVQKCSKTVINALEIPLRLDNSKKSSSTSSNIKRIGKREEHDQKRPNATLRLPSITQVLDDSFGVFVGVLPAMLEPLPPSPTRIDIDFDFSAGISKDTVFTSEDPKVLTAKPCEKHSAAESLQTAKENRDQKRDKDVFGAACSLGDLFAPKRENKTKNSKKNSFFSKRPVFLSELQYSTKALKHLYAADIDMNELLQRLSNKKNLATATSFAASLMVFKNNEDFMVTIIKRFNERNRENPIHDAAILMSPFERRVLGLLNQLENVEHLKGVLSLAMTYLYKAVLLSYLKPGKEGPDKRSIASYCRILCGMCRQKDDLSRMRILSYDIIRYLHCHPGSVLYLITSIAAVWPAVFSYSSQAYNDTTKKLTQPLTTTLEVVLTHLVRVGNWPMIGNIVGWLCSWKLVSPGILTLQELCDELVKLLKDPSFAQLMEDKDGYPVLGYGLYEVVKSLELITCIQGWVWLNNFLIREVIWGVLSSWGTQAITSTNKENHCQPFNFTKTPQKAIEPTDSNTKLNAQESLDSKYIGYTGNSPEVSSLTREEHTKNLITEPTVVATIRLLGLVCRLAIQQKQYEIPHVICMLFGILENKTQDKKVTFAIELATAYSLLDMSPWQPKEVFSSLNSWKEQSKRVLPPSLEQGFCSLQSTLYDGRRVQTYVQQR